MAAVSGRGPGARVVTASVTAASTAVTAPAGTFDPATDVGRPVSGPGIPAGATLTAVASATAATLSANATATGANISLTLAARATHAANAPIEAAFGFRGWSPESPDEAKTYQMTGGPAGGPGVSEPSRVTDPNTGNTHRDRRR